MKHLQGLLSPDLLLWDVMDEHLREAGFHGQVRRDELCADDRTLDDVGATEERLFAHIEGLVLGGALVEDRLLLPALAGDDAELAFAAALSLLRSEAGDRSALVMDRLASAGGASRAGIAEALELLAPASAQEHLRSLQESGDDVVRAAAIRILGRRGSMPSPQVIANGSGAGPSSLLAGLEAVRSGRDPRYRSSISSALDHPDAGVRDAAMVTGLVHGVQSAWTKCLDTVSTGRRPLQQSLCLLAFSGGDEEAALLEGCLEDREARADVAFALGYTGRPWAADFCVQLMKERALAPHAAEAFAFITGVRLEAEGLLAPRREPDDEEAPPFEDGDANTVPAGRPEDDSLPSPRADAVFTWWQEHRCRFDPRRRYLQGREVAPESYRAVFASASTKRRRGLALEIAIRSAGALLIQTSALVRIQQAQAERIATLPPSIFHAPLAALLRVLALPRRGCRLLPRAGNARMARGV